MSDDIAADPKAMLDRPVVLSLDRMDEVTVRQGIEYRLSAGEPLHFDLYLPIYHGSERRYFPVVILALGYSDVGARQLLGRNLKDVASYDGWARLLALSGLAAVIYETIEPAEDLSALYEFLKIEARRLGIDASRVGVWSCSGNVPNALAFMIGRPELRGAAFCYGYMLDLDGSTAVADAAASFGFVTPAGPDAMDELPPVPMLVVRAGADALPGLNDSQVAFCAQAEARDLPVRLIEHPTGPHAFDIFDDSDTSRSVIGEVLAFMRSSLDG